MNILLRIGTAVVFFALLFYSIGIFTEQQTRRVTPRVLIFLTLGIFTDILATVLMVAGSSRGFLTLHGIIGYSSLVGMFIENVLIWRIRFKSGIAADVPEPIHRYSKYAYYWWVIAFITGGLLVLLSRMG